MPPRRRRWTKKRRSSQRALQWPEWWGIRRILEENTIQGQLNYLVDWVDSEAGESFDPTWVPAGDVLEEAVTEWERSKTSANKEGTADREDDSSQDSRPPRPADAGRTPRPNSALGQKRPRGDEIDDEEQDHSRKRGKADAASPSLEPVPSVTSGSSCDTSTIEESSIQRPPGNISVELKRQSGLDTSEYISIPSDSQPTSHSSQPLSQLESEDQRVIISSRLSQGTIPDSEDPSSLGVVESQQAETQPISTPNAVEIPDSQDPWRTESSENAPEHQRGPACDPQADSSRSHDTVIPASTGAEQEIPSHQVAPRQDTPFQESGLSTGQAGGSEETPSGSSPLKTQERQIHTQTQDPVFTQPNLSGAKRSPRVLGNVSILNEPEVSAPETSTPASDNQYPTNIHSRRVETASLRESQAAQVVHHHYEVNHGDFGESHGTFAGAHLSERHIAENKSPGSDRNNCVGEVEPVRSAGSLVTSHLQESVQNFASRHTSAFQQSATEICRRGLEAFDRGKIPPVSTMIPSQEKDSSSEDHPVSAVTQLQNIWDASHPSDPAHDGTDTIGHSHADAPGTTTLSALNVMPQVSRPDGSESTPSGFFFTQPPHQETTWRGSSANADSAEEYHRRSAADSMQDLLNQAFGTPDVQYSEGSMPPPMQATVSPADVSKPVQSERGLALLSSLTGSGVVSSATYEEPTNAITMDRIPQMEAESSASSEQETDSVDCLVTLPFQASMRSLYDETLMKYRASVTKFGEAFNNEEYVPPDEGTTKSIDELVGILRNICDYPEDVIGTSIEKMQPKDKVKYSLDANAKFNFLYELLQGIKNDVKVLIVARSSNLLRPLCELVEVLELDCTCNVLGHVAKDIHRNSAVRVTLALPDMADPFQFDVVVGYDDAFNSSNMSAELANNASNRRKPLVLRLTTTYSIEHINIFIEDSPNALERRNKLLFGVANARQFIRDLPRSLEPHEIAKSFVEYLNEETNLPMWEPDPLPGEILDAYMSSQMTTQMPLPSYTNPDNGRKRKLNDEEDAEIKRMRRFSGSRPISENQTPPLTNDIRKLLKKAGFTESKSDESQLSVPLSVLETLAAKMAEAERAAEARDYEADDKKLLDQLGNQVKEYEGSMETIHEKYRSALEDRTQFEIQARNVEKALQAKTEENQKAKETNAAKIAELESKIARLTDDAATGSSLGATEKLLTEAQEKIKLLERRLETSHSNEEYARKLYQDATSATTATRAENDDLKGQVEELRKKASDNFRHIHEMQRENAALDLSRKIVELETRVGERERELDRVREELRQVRSARRETRQVSVPQSPRMGLMSPRAPRPIAGIGSRAASPAAVASGFDTSASSSAGTSLQGATFASPPHGGNGRRGFSR